MPTTSDEIPVRAVRDGNWPADFGLCPFWGLGGLVDASEDWEVCDCCGRIKW